MKIGVFDSGFGGLTILKEIRRALPQYDYLYLGDSARAPYGTRSFEVIYEYTLQAVRYLEAQGCRLIIIACNTASAKALRTIQQRDINPDRLRVLGVIRPTAEAVAGAAASSLKAERLIGTAASSLEAERQRGAAASSLEAERHIGVLATQGTVSSESYLLELKKLNPDLKVTQQACPMWVPLIESNEINTPAMDFYIKKYIDELIDKDPDIDTLILGCTHYPLIKDKIENYLNSKLTNETATLNSKLAQRASTLNLISQGAIVADSLRDYLNRHSEIECALSRGGQCEYLTTDIAEKFETSASLFLSEPIRATQIELV